MTRKTMSRRIALALLFALGIPLAMACGSNISDYPGGGRRLTPPGGEGGGVALDPVDAETPPTKRDAGTPVIDTGTPMLPDASVTD